MMPIPVYQQPTPQPTYAPQQYVQQPYAPQPQTYQPQPAFGVNGWQPSPQSPVLAVQAAQTNQPKAARGYAPEQKPACPTPAAPKTIQLPTPEELGLKSTAAPAAPTPTLPATAQAKVAEVDWNQTHARLREIGAVGFHVDHLPGGVTRVRMLMPTADPGQSRLVEAIASTDAAALESLFERARP